MKALADVADADERLDALGVGLLTRTVDDLWIKSNETNRSAIEALDYVAKLNATLNDAIAEGVNTTINVARAAFDSAYVESIVLNDQANVDFDAAGVATQSLDKKKLDFAASKATVEQARQDAAAAEEAAEEAKIALEYLRKGASAAEFNEHEKIAEGAVEDAKKAITDALAASKYALEQMKNEELKVAETEGHAGLLLEEARVEHNKTLAIVPKAVAGEEAASKRLSDHEAEVNRLEAEVNRTQGLVDTEMRAEEAAREAASQGQQVLTNLNNDVTSDQNAAAAQQAQANATNADINQTQGAVNATIAASSQAASQLAAAQNASIAANATLTADENAAAANAQTITNDTNAVINSQSSVDAAEAITASSLLSVADKEAEIKSRDEAAAFKEVLQRAKEEEEMANNNASIVSANTSLTFANMSLWSARRAAAELHLEIDKTNQSIVELEAQLVVNVQVVADWKEVQGTVNAQLPAVEAEEAAYYTALAAAEHNVSSGEAVVDAAILNVTTCTASARLAAIVSNNSDAAARLAVSNLIDARQQAATQHAADVLAVSEADTAAQNAVLDADAAEAALTALENQMGVARTTLEDAEAAVNQTKEALRRARVTSLAANSSVEDSAEDVQFARLHLNGSQGLLDSAEAAEQALLNAKLTAHADYNSSVYNWNNSKTDQENAQLCLTAAQSHVADMNVTAVAAAAAFALATGNHATDQQEFDTQEAAFTTATTAKDAAIIAAQNAEWVLANATNTKTDQEAALEVSEARVVTLTADTLAAQDALALLVAAHLQAQSSLNAANQTVSQDSQQTNFSKLQMILSNNTVMIMLHDYAAKSEAKQEAEEKLQTAELELSDAVVEAGDANTASGDATTRAATLEQTALGKEANATAKRSVAAAARNESNIATKAARAAQARKIAAIRAYQAAQIAQTRASSESAAATTQVEETEGRLIERTTQLQAANATFQDTKRSEEEAEVIRANATADYDAADQASVTAKQAYKDARVQAKTLIEIAKAADAAFAQQMEAEEAEYDPDDELAIAREEAQDIRNEGRQEVADTIESAKDEIAFENAQHQEGIDDSNATAREREQAMLDAIQTIRSQAEDEIAKGAAAAAAVRQQVLNQSRLEADALRAGVSSDVQAIWTRANERIAQINADAAVVASDIQTIAEQAATDQKQEAIDAGVSAANAQTIADETKAEADKQVAFTNTAAESDVNKVKLTARMKAARIARDANFTADMRIARGAEDADAKQDTSNQQGRLIDMDREVEAAKVAGVEDATVQSAEQTRTSAATAFEAARKQIAAIRDQAEENARARMVEVEAQADKTVTETEKYLSRMTSRANTQAARIQAQADAKVKQIQKECAESNASPTQIRAMAVLETESSVVMLEVGEGSEDPVQAAMEARQLRDEAKVAYITSRRVRRVAKSRLRSASTELKKWQSRRAQAETKYDAASVKHTVASQLLTTHEGEQTAAAQVLVDANLRLQEASAHAANTTGGVQGSRRLSLTLLATFKEKNTEANMAEFKAKMARHFANNAREEARVAALRWTLAGYSVGNATVHRDNMTALVNATTEAVQAAEGPLNAARQDVTTKVAQFLTDLGIENADRISVLLAGEVALEAMENRTAKQTLLAGSLNRTLTQEIETRDGLVVSLAATRALITNATIDEQTTSTDLTSATTSWQTSRDDLSDAREALDHTSAILANTTTTKFHADAALDAATLRQQECHANLTLITARLLDHRTAAHANAGLLQNATASYQQMLAHVANMTQNNMNANSSVVALLSALQLLNQNASSSAEAVEAAVIAYASALQTFQSLQVALEDAEQLVASGNETVTSAKLNVTTAAEYAANMRNISETNSAFAANTIEHAQNMSARANASAVEATANVDSTATECDRAQEALQAAREVLQQLKGALNQTQNLSSAVARAEAVRRQAQLVASNLTEAETNVTSVNTSLHLARTLLADTKWGLNKTMHIILIKLGVVAGDQEALAKARAHALQYADELRKARAFAATLLVNGTLTDEALRALKKHADDAKARLETAEAAHEAAQATLDAAEQERLDIEAAIQRARDARDAALLAVNNSNSSQADAALILAEAEAELQRLEESAAAHQRQMETMQEELQLALTERENANIAHKASVATVLATAEAHLSESQNNAMLAMEAYDKAVQMTPHLKELLQTAKEYKANTDLLVEAAAERVQAYQEQFDLVKKRKEHQDQELAALATEVTTLSSQATTSGNTSTDATTTGGGTGGGSEEFVKEALLGETASLLGEVTMLLQQ
jgi:hypothetical protein